MSTQHEAYIHSMLEPDSNSIRSPSDSSVIRIANFIKQLNQKHGNRSPDQAAQVCQSNIGGTKSATESRADAGSESINKS